MTDTDTMTVAEMIHRNALDTARTVRILTEVAHGLDERTRGGSAPGGITASDITVTERPGAPDAVTVTGGGGDPDPRADVRALGWVLYEMLTGTVPDRRSAPPAPSHVNPWVSTGFDAVVAKALVDDPTDRYPSCAALAEAAAGLAGDTMRITAPLPPPRPRRRLAIGLTLATIVLVAVAVSVSLGLRGESSTSSAATNTTRSPELTWALWGSYSFVYEAFPNLLPASADGVGYDELYPCTPVDYRSEAVSLYEPVRLARVFCTGDRAPVTAVTVTCNTDRKPFTPERSPTWKVEGDERWTRPSGTGTLRSGSFVNTSNETIGRLEVYFDDPQRKFCYLRISGPGSATELRDRWWTDAPL